MIIPLKTDYRMRHKPWVNYALLAINVAVFFLGYQAGSEKGLRLVYDYMLHPDDPALVQFFSSMFLHSGFMHLAGNMLFLWVFGSAINDRLGNVGYLAFYLAGGILASTGYLLLGGAAPVVGASGAISAVTGAYLVLLPRSRVTVLAMLIYVLMPFEISSLYFLGFQVIWNLIGTVGGMTRFTGGGIAFAAHLSGYFFGIGLAAGLLALQVLPRDSFDLLNLIKARKRRSRYRRMATQGYDPFSPANSKIRKPTGRWVESQTVDQKTGETPTSRELELRKEISKAVSQHDLGEAARCYLELVQIADEPVLPQGQQLDVANHLMANEQHSAAADAYERFLKHYGNYEYLADIYLMLGLLYGRYLQQYDRAEKCLERAVEALHDPQKLKLAQDDLRTVRRRRR